MVTLARQILEATPERIKQEPPLPGGGPENGGAPGGLSAAMAWLATYLDSVDRPPPQRQEAPPPPPFSRWGGPERFPPPSWAEFLGASARLESDFALLTLSDHEQHELYEAARIIQSAFRRARGRRLKEQQEVAAAVIQRCYRKYKQFALFQRMTRAAILIQSKFRSYQEQKRFQRRRRAALLIQQRFRSHRQGLQGPPRAPPAPAPRTKAPFLTKKQDQAARKIMRFLRRCRHRMKELKQSRELESSQQRGLAS